MGVVIKFLTGFITKYFTTVVIEKIVIILLGALVKKTDSKVDDELYNAVFNKTTESEVEK